MRGLSGIIHVGPMQAQGPSKRGAGDPLAACNVMRWDGGEWDEMWTLSQRMQVAWKSWKKQKKSFHKSLQKEHSPDDKLILDFRPPDP